MLTKVTIVKVKVFPVIMYRYESWAVKKAEHQKTDVLKLWCLRLLNSLDCKELKPVNPKGNQPEYSLDRLMLKLKLQYLGHLLQRANSLEKTLMLGKTEGKRRRERQMMKWLNSIT